MDILNSLEGIYARLGILGFLSVLMGFVIIFLLTEYALITKKFFSTIDKLAQENKRLNDALIGLSAFIQSFLSVIAEHEDALEVIECKFKEKRAKNDPTNIDQIIERSKPSARPDSPKTN